MSDGDVIVVQLTDLHLSPSHPFFLANWRAALDDLDGTTPDFVVISGDLTVNGADWVDDLELAAREIAPLKPLCLPGNHDIGECRRDHDQPVDAERLERYRSVLGADHWVRDLGAWRFIGLNSQIMGSGLPQEAEQRRCAEQAFADAAERFVAVFLHKPMFMETLDEADEPDHAVPGPARRWLADLFARRRVRLVACGHAHQYRVRELDGIPHVWAPATSFMTHHEFGGEHIAGLLTWRFTPDGTVAHDLSTPPRLAPLQLEDIRGDHATLRAMPPDAVAAAMRDL